MKIIKSIGLVVLICSVGEVIAQKKKTEESAEEIRTKELKAETSFIEGMKFFIAEDYKKATTIFKEVIEKQDDDAGVYFMLAKAQAAQKEIPAAILSAEKALEKDNSNKFYCKFLAELYIQQNNLKKAVELYQSLAKQYPLDVDNYLDLSNIYIQQGNYSAALKVYDEIEKAIGVSEDISRQKQLIYLQQNNVDEAVKEGKKLIDSEPLEPDYVIQQAQLLISNQRYNEAIGLLEKALVQNKNFADAHILLAEIYRIKGEPEKSANELNLAFTSKELSTDIKLKLLASYSAVAQNDKNSIDNVITLAKQLIEQSPDNARTYLILGDMYKLKNQLKEARDAYAKSTEFDKSVFEVWVAIIELDNSLNDHKSMAKYAAQATEYFPNQAVLWYHSGFANFQIRDLNEASFALEEAQNLAFSNKELLVAINSLLGDVYNEQKNYKKSAETYEAVLKTDPTNEHVLNNYSYYLAMRKDNLDRAKELSGKLVEKFPNNASYLDTHGWVLYQRKEYDAAKTFIEKAASVAGASGTVIEHYGDVLFQLGKKEDAIEQWKKAKKLGRTSPLLDSKIANGSLVE